jgi:hypothetical protein
VQECVLGGDGCFVCLKGGSGPVDQHLAFSVRLVADPPQLHLADAEDVGGGAEGLLGLIDQGRVDGVHQPSVVLPGGLP